MGGFVDTGGIPAYLIEDARAEFPDIQDGIRPEGR